MAQAGGTASGYAPAVPANPDPIKPAPLAASAAHQRRLREIWRSAGWPCQDLIEAELLAAGLLERVRHGGGRETLRVTDAGVAEAGAAAGAAAIGAGAGPAAAGFAANRRDQRLMHPPSAARPRRPAARA